MINYPLVSSQVFTLMGTQETRLLPAAEFYLHGLMIYPPVDLLQSSQADQLLYHSINWDMAQQVAGVVKCIQKKNFLAIVASQHTEAKRARSLVEIDWLSLPATTPKAQSSVKKDHYSWELSENNQLAWAVASYRDDTLQVWLSTIYVSQLRKELHILTGLPLEKIEIYQNTTALSEAYDVAVEAALLALEVHRPVFMQAETQLQTIRFGLQDSISNTDVWTGNTLPALGVSLAAYMLGWRRQDGNELVVDIDYAGTVSNTSASSYTPTGHSKDYAAALSFALESEFDESRREQEIDPIQERLQSIDDDRGKQLIERVAQQAGWINENGIPYVPHQENKGYGFAYVKAFDYEQEPAQQVWAAWAVELELDKKQQHLHLQKVTVAFDTDTYADENAEPLHLKQRIGQWAQKLLGTTAAADLAQKNKTNTTDDNQAASTSNEIQVHVVNQSAIAGRALAWSKTAELPAAAAIANAVKDVTGVRLYHAPLDLSSAVGQLGYAQKKNGKRNAWLGWTGGVLTAITGALLVASPWRGAIPPVRTVDTSIFSSQAIERGRLVAAAADCMVCHTTDNGKTNAGGLGLDTPFGIIYSTNITPDVETGIGSWSYKAFERAMREGIHQDGSHLYPAFPYTSYAKMSDEDLQSLYAYLMTQEPVHAENPKTELPFPFNVRSAMAGWNLLFHTDRQAYQPFEDQTQLWNRGAYLVNSSGHCAACHSPRNTLGAEKKGEHFLSGGLADGWEAPALNALSKAPIPWTEQELYQYLRTGESTRHGVAAGPMGPVIAGLAELPEYDVRAISNYLVNLNPKTAQTEPVAVAATETVHATQAVQLEKQAQQAETDLLLMPGQQIYAGACAVCHDATGGPALFGSKPSLALNTNIHSENPDNLIQVIMHGITRPSAPGLGNMPAFKNSLNDGQIKDVVQYVRKRFAPNQPEWTGLEKHIKDIRNQPGHL